MSIDNEMYHFIRKLCSRKNDELCYKLLTAEYRGADGTVIFIGGKPAYTVRNGDYNTAARVIYIAGLAYKEGANNAEQYSETSQCHAPQAVFGRISGGSRVNAIKPRPLW